MGVVEALERRDGVGHVAPRRRDEDVSEVLTLECADKPLDDGDAAVLSDRAVARAGLVARTPLAEVGAHELRATVGHDVLWRCAGVLDGGVEDAGELSARGLPPEDAEVYELA